MKLCSRKPASLPANHEDDCLIVITAPLTKRMGFYFMQDANVRDVRFVDYFVECMYPESYSYIRKEKDTIQKCYL